MALNFPATPTSGDTFVNEGTTWTFDGTVWNVTASIPPSSVQDLYETVSGDTGSTTASTPTDSLTISGGTNISTEVTNDTVTINYTGGAGGGASNLTELGDVNITTPSTGQVLKYDGAEWINDTDNTGSAGTFSELTEVSSASLNFSAIYEPAITMFKVDNNGSIAYTFTPHYTGDNPSLSLISGFTVAFDLTGIAGHPFEIQDATGDPFNTGLVHVANDGTVSTEAAAQGKDSGVLYWRIPEAQSGTYRYQCQVHAPMVGSISLTRASLL